jgi:hypothetical protein
MADKKLLRQEQNYKENFELKYEIKHAKRTL